MANKTRVLILGGGFGGLYAALEFEKRRDPRFEVTVVNRENFFLFTPMLHEIAASDLDLTNIVNPVRKMIRRVNFFCGDVDKIDIDKKEVVVSHGFDRHSHTLEYDHLVLALGSVTNFFGLPGVAERAVTMKSLGDAIQLRNRLIAHLEEADTECARAERPPLLSFVVAGGGFAGVKRSRASTTFCAMRSHSTPTSEKRCYGSCWFILANSFCRNSGESLVVMRTRRCALAAWRFSRNQKLQR